MVNYKKLYSEYGFYIVNFRPKVENFEKLYSESTFLYSEFLKSYSEFSFYIVYGGRLRIL